MDDESGTYIEVRGGTQDGIVYLRASDVIESLRLTAKGFRDVAEEDKELSSIWSEMARVFEGEADQFDLLAIELATDEDDDVSLDELDEESDG